jgi:aromatic ring-opening dioxygenase LigB subunit
MPLVGGAVLPHGALILDPDRPEMAGELSESARRLHKGCIEAGRAIRATRPDVILLYTPHGLIGEGADMFLYTNASASGSCEWMSGWAEHRVSVRCDADAALSLLAHLKAGGHSAAGLTAFSGYDAPLRWGECVPLSFLGAALADGARVVVLSHGPAGTVDRAALTRGRWEETCAMGAAVGEWALAQQKRIFFLVSGDLAHVHGNSRAPSLPDGAPDPRYLNAKYPLAHASAVPFETCVKKWAGSRVSELGRDVMKSGALSTALEYVEDAMCCGIEGFAMLQDALHCTAGNFEGRVYAHEVRVSSVHCGVSSAQSAVGSGH